MNVTCIVEIWDNDESKLGAVALSVFNIKKR